MNFNPFSTNPAGIQSKIFFLGCNLKFTTRQILTRLNILGNNPAWVATSLIGNGLNLKNQKFACMDQL
jgi:hypothetical protein